MNRQQFMEELEQLLQDLSEDERREALRYYEDYFEDAGPEHEAEVIAEFESPAKLAKVVRAGVAEGDATQITYERIPSENEAQTNGWLLALLIILILCTYPFSVVTSYVAIGVVILIFLIAICIALMMFACSVVSFLSGILLIGSGIGKAFEILWGGLSMVCGGIILCGGGILLLAISLWMFFYLIPWMFKVLIRIFRGKKKGGKNNA